MFKGEKNTGYIAATCAAQGIRHVVICPGSRSAPLTLAFVRSGKFDCLSVVDERSAAFIALGIAQQTQETVALICTSGSATLNFAPAISEAYYQGIPLLVLTADRPQEWIDQHDGQAIRQVHIYQNFIGKSYHLQGEIFSEEDIWFTQRTLHEALFFAKKHQLPVHVNVAFREPLYENPSVDAQRVQALSFPTPNTQSWDQSLIAPLQHYKKILIVAGQHHQFSDSLSRALQQLANLPQVVVVAESISNIKGDFITNVNECISLPKGETLQPDCILSFGKSIISKKLKQFLRKSSAAHWHISTDDTLRDVYQRLSHHLTGDATSFFQLLAAHLSAQESSFAQEWKNVSDAAMQVRDVYAQDVDFSDFSAAQFVLQHLPENINLHLGNSAIVRYAQVFASSIPSSVLVNSNRGTSGIDGCSSTAVGAAYVNKKKTFLLSGELSFHYDLNAFWNRYVSKDLRLVVFNNSGGNIFRLIDGSSSVEELESYFETRQTNDFQQIAAHYQLGYYSAASASELASVWETFVHDSDKAQLLEIKTDPVISERVFRGLYAALKNSGL